MAIYVYKTADGSLVSWCPGDTDPVASPAVLAAQGFAMVSGLAALDATHAWNAATKQVDIVPAPTLPIWISCYQFVLLFTPAEHAAIDSSTDQKVRQLWTAMTVAQRINLTDPVLHGGIAYLVSIGLLTQANANLILSGQPSA